MHGYIGTHIQAFLSMVYSYHLTHLNVNMSTVKKSRQYCLWSTRGSIPFSLGCLNTSWFVILLPAWIVFYEEELAGPATNNEWHLLHYSLARVEFSVCPSCWIQTCALHGQGLLGCSIVRRASLITCQFLSFGHFIPPPFFSSATLRDCHLPSESNSNPERRGIFYC